MTHNFLVECPFSRLLARASNRDSISRDLVVLVEDSVTVDLMVVELLAEELLAAVELATVEALALVATDINDRENSISLCIY